MQLGEFVVLVDNFTILQFSTIFTIFIFLKLFDCYNIANV